VRQNRTEIPRSPTALDLPLDLENSLMDAAIDAASVEPHLPSCGSELMRQDPATWYAVCDKVLNVLRAISIFPLTIVELQATAAAANGEGEAK
jgi:hypothetical protein